MSIEIERLHNRHTVKNFTSKKISSEVLKNALTIAAKTPTSLNSRPVRIIDISNQLDAEWVSHQTAVKTAPHLFALTFSSETAEQNIREHMSHVFGAETDDARIEGLLDNYVRPGGEHYPELQLYLVAGYFSATLEMQGASGCWIRGFDPIAAKKELDLPEHESVGLLFAAGIEAK